MKLETITKLCCSFDKSEIELTVITKDTAGNILEGFLFCNECKRLFPIVKGIPIMSPDEYREYRLEQPLIERWQQYLGEKRFENFRLVGLEKEESKKITM